MPQFLDLVVAIYALVFFRERKHPSYTVVLWNLAVFTYLHCFPSKFGCLHLSSLVPSSESEWIPRSSFPPVSVWGFIVKKQLNLQILNQTMFYSLYGIFNHTYVVIWGIARIYHQIQLKIPSNNSDFVELLPFSFIFSLYLLLL